MLESPNNPYVKHLRKLAEDSRYRQEKEQVFVEGRKLILELLPMSKSGTLFSKDPFPSHLKHVMLSDAVQRKLATFKGSDLFAELTLPKPSMPKKFTHVLALDAVSEPGNLGTLLRTALALSWDGVFLLPGCCDPFNDKALRASKGALFKLPYQKGSWEDLVGLAKESQIPLIAAALEGKKPEQQNCILILGNEGQGLSQKARQLEKVAIPMSGNMESLNVSAAGAILMYVSKQL